MGIFDKIFGKKKVNKTVPQVQTSKPPQSSIPPPPPQGTTEMMDEDQFWKIVETSKSNSPGDYEKQQDELQKELRKLAANDILKFDNRFSTYRGDAYKWELWGAAYIMNGGCGDDGFSDFRGWLIGQGKEAYFTALSNPETLEVLNHEMGDDWEGISYVPMTTYEEKKGSQMPRGIQENFEIIGEEWEEDDLQNKFPKLWAKWGFE